MQRLLVFPLRHTRLGSSDSDECKKAFSHACAILRIVEYRLSYSALSANETDYLNETGLC
jgi:hypothetical protein